MASMNRGVFSRTIKGLRRISAYWAAPSELDQMIAGHTGRRINKWKHYFEIYDRHFARLRHRPITVLEIGVDRGGSLEIWRRYFGTKAQIVGVDVNPACKNFEAPGIRIAIGDQGDARFLENLAGEFGPFDIVIDDGSHAFEHQLITFRTLFPHIQLDGIYVCEDLCSSYWSEDFGADLRQPNTFVEFLKGLIDELNAWFWRDDIDKDVNSFAMSTHGMHFYPALIVIEKRLMQRPILTPVGKAR